MKLHTDHLTPHDLAASALIARKQYGQDIHIIDASIAGSRSRARRIDFHGGAEYGRHANSGTRGAGYDRAATWTAWGYLIAELFNRDPNAIIGPYKGTTDYRRQVDAVTWQDANAKRFLDHLR